MTCFKRDLENQGCCNNWQNGIRTINGQYPDDNREFKIMEGAGILITPVTAGIKITNATDPGALEAGQNIELTPNGDHLQIGTTDDIAVTGDLSVAGDSTLNGDLNVNGNIYNQGASYESHMEQVYTNDDYIIMRDGAVAALPNGQYAGFQVKKYDGTNDGRLVIDKTGTARVGDVGDEQPLLTREESADLSNGDILTWDAANSKAVGVPIDATPTDGSSNPVSSDGVYDSRFTQVLYRAGLTISNGLPATISELTQLGDDCIIYFCFKNNTTGLEQWYSAPFHTQHAFFSGTDTNRFNNNDVPYIFGFSVTWSRTTGEVTVTSKHTHGGSDSWSLDGFEYLNIINVYGRKV